MTIRSIIVDDEPLSQKILRRYLDDIPNIELVASCDNAFEAMEVLQKESIQLIFLDINMPRLSGINFLKSLTHPPLVIFITAYPEYAVEGFELDAVDYLLKPFSFERFLKATNKARKAIASSEADSLPKKENLIFKSDKKLYKISFSEILFLQAYGDYVKIITLEKTFLTKERLANLEDKIPSNEFTKIHRSYIIALDKINYIEGNQVSIADNLLPISQTYKESLISKMSENK